MASVACRAGARALDPDDETAAVADRLRLVGEANIVGDDQAQRVKANASGSSNPGLLSAKFANSTQTSNTLHKTYAPVDAVLAFDKARLAGREKRRGQNED